MKDLRVGTASDSESACVITVGDEHAALWWDGEHWTYSPASAKPYADWHEAKRLMEELRNSRGSTIRTTHLPVLKRRPTIEELETMMDDPDCDVGILPSGELVANPSRHFSEDVPKLVDALLGRDPHKPPRK